MTKFLPHLTNDPVLFYSRLDKSIQPSSESCNSHCKMVGDQHMFPSLRLFKWLAGMPLLQIPSCLPKSPLSRPTASGDASPTLEEPEVTCPCQRTLVSAGSLAKAPSTQNISQYFGKPRIIYLGLNFPPVSLFISRPPRSLLWRGLSSMFNRLGVRQNEQSSMNNILSMYRK